MRTRRSSSSKAKAASYRKHSKSSHCRKLKASTCKRTKGCKRASGTKRSFCRKTHNEHYLW